MKDYRKLIKNIQARTNPENIILEKAFSDELSFAEKARSIEKMRIHEKKCKAKSVV